MAKEEKSEHIKSNFYYLSFRSERILFSRQGVKWLFDGHS